MRAAAPPRLIVNADDLGIHPAINQGIRQAAEQGIVTSASLLVTTDHVQHALDEVARPTGLGLGLHLNLTMGRPCSDPSAIPLLVDRGGLLHVTPIALYKRFMWGRRPEALLEQMRLECEAQFARARDLGADCTHFDSHQHIHMIPPLFALLQDLAPRYGISRVRTLHEPLYAFWLWNRPLEAIRRKNPLKWAVIRANTARMPNRLATTDGFYGLMATGMISAQAVRCFLRRLRPGRTYELALHPGHSAPAPDPLLLPNFNRYITSPDRQKELDIVLDPDLRELIRARGVELISYAEIRA